MNRNFLFLVGLNPPSRTSQLTSAVPLLNWFLPTGLHCVFLLIIAVAAFEVPFAAAQTGFPPYNSFQNNGVDFINEGNLNIHAEWEITRNVSIGPPFDFRITYDGGGIGTIFTNGSGTWAGRPTPEGLWMKDFRDNLGYVSTYSSNLNGNCQTFTTTYTDGHNTVHKFSGLVLAAGGGTTLCSTPTTTGGALDGSGYIITDTNADGETGGYSPTITDPHGNTITGGQRWTGNYLITKLTDPNGNVIMNSWGNGTGSVTYTGPLGTTLLSYTQAQPTTTYNFPGGNGPASASIHYSSISYTTNFNCSGITEKTGSISTPDKITLADGSVYTFQYDSHQGYLNQINLPQGGYIQYNYTETVNCTAGTVTVTGLTRTTHDNVSNTSGQWTYAQTGTLASSTTTETAPSGDRQVIAFQNYSEVDRKIYSGSSTLLEEIVKCFNYTNAAPCITPTGVNTAGTSPKALTAIRYLNGSTSGAQTVTYYGNAAPYLSGVQLGIATETDAYDFGATTPTKQVSTPTGSWNGSSCVAIGNNILDRHCYVNVSGGGYNSSTTFTYDSKGNISTINRYSGTTWLPTQYSYDTNGTISKIIDPNGSYTTFTSKTCGTSPYAFPQNIKTYNAGGGLLPYPSTSLTYDSSCNSARPLTVTDANGQPTTYTYIDSLWRLTSLMDPLGNTTQISYTPTTTESVLNFGSATVDALSTVDGLGRAFLSQKRQAPSSSSFDTVATNYDANERVSSVGLPCTSTSSASCSSAGTTITYDGLDRPLQKQDGGGGTATVIYSQNDVKVTIGPAPAGENSKNIQTQNDGLGRPTSTCQILSAGGSSCGQNAPASGYLTSYSYAATAGGTTTTATLGVQTRTTARDALGRMLSQTTPESGTTTYIYDSVSQDACTLAGGRSSYGDLLRKTTPTGYTCYQYDNLHRVVAVGNIISNTTNPCKRFGYDNAQGVLGSIPTGVTVNNTMGRMVEAETDTCAWPITQSSIITDEWFSYDKDGRLTDVYEFTPHSGGYYHTTVGFFANGVPSSLSGLPGLAAYSYNVDGEGRSYSAAQGTTTLVNGVTYNEASQPRIVRVGSSGDQDTYTYDPNTGRMTNYTFTVKSASESGTPTWNANGTLRQLAITDGFNSAGTQTCNFGSAGVAGYDDLGRLVSDNCGSIWSQTFSYDQYDNVTKSGSITWSPGYNTANNQYSSIGATYDNAGNLLYDSFNTYTWDIHGKMASVYGTHVAATCGSTGTCITYDAFGHAVEKSLAGTYSEILYSPLGKTAIMSGQTLTYAYLPMPGGQSSMYEKGGIHHFEHHDWRGSVVLRTSIGNRTNDFDRAFAPFGEAYDSFGASGNLNFTGDTQDIWVGLFDTPNRELAPEQGRWLSPDPAGAGWNRYSYASNNPLGLVDPSGLGPDNPHWENFDARVYVFDSSFDASLNPGDAYIQGAIQSFQVQAGLNSPIQQGAAVYQAQVDCGFNPGSCPNGVPGTPGGPVLIPGGSTSCSYTTSAGDSGTCGIRTFQAYSVPGDIWDGYAANAYMRLRQWWDANWYYKLGLTEEDATANRLAGMISSEFTTILTPCDGLEVGSTLMALEFLGEFGESKLAKTTTKVLGGTGAVGAVASMGCN